MSKRMTKIMDLANRAATNAEAELAAAIRQTTAAEEIVAKAEAALQSAIDWNEPVSSVAELADIDARIRVRRTQLERAHQSALAVKREEAKKRAAVVEARTNARRFEIWIERTETARKANVDRKARLAEDELAARSWSPS